MNTKFKQLAALLFLVYSVIGQAIGQKPPTLSINELKLQLARSKKDTTAVTLLYNTGKLYASKVGVPTNTEAHVNDSAVHYLKRTIKLGDSLGYSRFKRESSITIGKVHLLSGEVTEGKKWITQEIHFEHALYHQEKEADLWTIMGQYLLHDHENHDDIMSSYERAIAIYHELKLWDKETDIKIRTADLDMYTGDFKKCEKKLLEVLDTYREHKKSKTFNIYYLLSVSNRYDGDMSAALSYAMKCVQNMKQEKDTVSAAYFYGEMGLVYQGLNQVEESIHWYKQALAKVEFNHRTTDIYFTAGFLISQLIKQKKEKEALQLLERLNHQYPPILPMDKACAAQCYGRCFEALHQFEKAEHYYLEMIKQYSKSNRLDEYKVIAFHDIGAFYTHQKKYTLARQYLSKALQMPVGINFSTWERRKDVHLMLFEADSAQGNYIAAIEHLRKHDQLNDSIFNAEKMREIEKLQAQFNVAEKEKEIMTLNSSYKLQQQDLRQTTLVRNFVVVGILIVLGFVYYRYKIKQKSNQQLEAQQKEINKKNQNLEHLVKEREWLLKEIHHRVKNNFQMVTSLLGTQTHYVKSEEASQYLEESQHRIYAMSLIHQRLYQAGNYSTINMKDYIHELVDYLRDCLPTRQHVFFDIQTEEIELNIAHALPIGLILNESITNAIKYAFNGRDEGKVQILLQQKSEDTVVLTITDDGIGLPPQLNIEHSETMGMNLMKGLSEEIEGSINIGTNNGTTIQLIFNCKLNQTLVPYSIPTI